MKCRRTAWPDRTGADPSVRAHRLWLAALLQDKDELKRVLADPKLKPEVPPGMPIGTD